MNFPRRYLSSMCQTGGSLGKTKILYINSRLTQQINTNEFVLIANWKWSFWFEPTIMFEISVLCRKNDKEPPLKTTDVSCASDVRRNSAKILNTFDVSRASNDCWVSVFVWCEQNQRLKIEFLISLFILPSKVSSQD